MSETNYFWQGGRKIEVLKDNSQITIQANGLDEANSAAKDSGVTLSETESVGPRLIKASIVGDIELSVDRLRAQDTVIHHIYRDLNTSNNEYLITDSFFIKFKQDTPKKNILDYLTAENLIVEQDLGNKTFLVRVTTATGRNPIRTANAAVTREDVEYAEPNLVRPLMKFAWIPSDDLFSQQWHLHSPVSLQDLVEGAGIFAPGAWELNRGRREIVIAVADDGFDLTHPDFQGEGKVRARLNATVSRNGINGSLMWDENVAPRPGDYHGTPCLGVALAEGNGTGVVGVAPGCSLIAVRFPLGIMTDAHFITMFEKISGMADIISCSWGVGPADAPMSTTLNSTIASLARTGGRRGKGLVFCIAAGNNNCPIQDHENTLTYKFRDRFGIRNYSGRIDRWIAAHPDVITISASTSRKTRSAYSSWGKQLSICAPSDNWDDLGIISPQGLGITTTDNEGFGLNSDFSPGSRFTNQFGGTSSATPTVAGVCGLILSTNFSLSALEVRDILQRTADKDLSLETDTPVNVQGNFNTDGFSLWFGHGKVNAFRAVEYALAQLDAQTIIDVRANDSLEIPSNENPILSSIEVYQDGIINEFRVEVDINHTYIGDLRVDLVAPDGTGVVLQNYNGGSTHDLRRTYSIQDTPSLRSLLNRSIIGKWHLRVNDSFRVNFGRLNGWRIVARVTQ